MIKLIKLIIFAVNFIYIYAAGATEINNTLFGNVSYYNTYELISRSDAIIVKRYSALGDITRLGEPVYELSRIDLPDNRFVVKHEKAGYVITELVDSAHSLVRSNESILRGFKPSNIRLDLTTTVDMFSLLKVKKSVNVKFFPNTEQQITLKLEPKLMNQKMSTNDFIRIEIQFSCQEKVCLNNLLSGQTVEILL